MRRTGVLALQGDFAAHAAALRELGLDCREVRRTAELEGLEGLVIPGGESTTLLNLMGENEKIPVAGTVIWMTPKGAQGKRTAGIGVQFSEQDGGKTRAKIETHLAGALKSDRVTHTM